MQNFTSKVIPLQHDLVALPVPFVINSDFAVDKFGLQNELNTPYTNRGCLDFSNSAFPTKSTFYTVDFNCLTCVPPTNLPTAIVDYLSLTFNLQGFDASKLIGLKDWRNESVMFEDYTVDKIQQPLFPTREQFEIEQKIRQDWELANPNWRDNWLPQADVVIPNTDKFIKTDDAEVAAFLDFLMPVIPEMEFFPSANGLFGYKNCIIIMRGKVRAGVVAWGGNNSTCFLSLTGIGCAGVNMYDMRLIVEQLPFAKITRIDLAHDDFNGNVPLRIYQKWYSAGLFRSGRTNPKHLLIQHSDNSGDTFQVGDKANGKECCIYEKGKEQGDKQSPWTRCEVRLTSENRIIPFDTLTSPGHYLAGSYPCLRFLCHNYEIIETCKKAAKIGYEHCVKYAKILSGKVIYMMSELGLTPEQIINELKGDEIPRVMQAKVLTFAKPLPTISYLDWKFGVIPF